MSIAPDDLAPPVTPSIPTRIAPRAAADRHASLGDVPPGFECRVAGFFAIE